MTRQLPDPGTEVLQALAAGGPMPSAFEIPKWRFWGDKKPPENRSDFFSTTVAAAGDTSGGGSSDTAQTGSVATIRIYGPIDYLGGWWGVSSKDVAQALDSLPDDVSEIRVRINSPGGHAWEGLAIYNLLRAHKARVLTVVDGLGASAASVIACAGDERVMSPGTQLMVHDASAFAWGPAAVMRKASQFLDSLSNAIASVYTETAGGTDEAWRAVMVEETWYTAKEAVASALMQRVAVVPDAGATDTAGDDEPDRLLDEGDVEDHFDLARIYAHAGRSHAPAPKQPTASAAGSTSQAAPAPRDTSQEGASAMDDTQMTALRQKLGVSADADADTVLAAVDEALAERATSSAAAPGTVTVDEGTLAQLREDAAAGRQARNEQLEADRVATVTAAIQDGRIPAARRDHWLGQLRADDEGGRNVLNSLAKGTIPLEEVGHADAADAKTVRDEYEAMFPEHAQKQEA